MDYAINSLAPGRFQFDFRLVIFKLTLVNSGWGISYEIALRRMPLDLTDDNWTLVQVMAWCCHAPSHYLSQCWPRSMSPNGVNRPQWVNTNFTESIHKYIVQTWHVLLKITMAATTWFTADCLGRTLLVWLRWTAEAVFKISAGPWTLTSKIWVGPASFPSLPYINFGKNCASVRQVSDPILKTAEVV